jgi:hypothetical protein
MVLHAPEGLEARQDSSLYGIDPGATLELRERLSKKIFPDKVSGASWGAYLGTERASTDDEIIRFACERWAS